MDSQLQTRLNELYQAGKENDARQVDRRQKMLNLEPATAQFLSFLVRSSKRMRILEIGTSNGYSTCWLAWTAQQTGGHVTSIDREEHKHAQADANLRRLGLRERVELRCGDATEIVASLAGPFDCVFFDADRYSAPAQLALLLPKLAPEALLLADNAISHPTEIAGYLEAVQALEGFEHMVIPVGKGLSVAYRPTKG
ncbi:MAG TPA: class I SAM-dependent methyltransferase [Ktedonobacteraceae bacterium]|jgi:predicted O-methyltransferase YrrM